MGREKLRRECGLKSHFEHAREEGMLRGTVREERGLKSQMENASEDWTGRWG